jgi:type I restriction enzyme S subunit
VNIISGTSYKKHEVQNEGIRILRGGNIQDGKIILYDDDIHLPMKYRSDINTVYKNDILIVASTGSTDLIGKPAFALQNHLQTQIGAFLRIVRPLCTEYAPWLQIIFSSQFYREHIRRLAKGTNINNIKLEYITEFIIPFPPLAEQERIATVMNNIEVFIDATLKNIL